MKQLIDRLLIEEEGQGITEYALILGLVVFGIWLTITQTGIGAAISNIFSGVRATVEDCNTGGCAGGNQ